MNIFNKIIVVLILIAIVCVSVVGIFNSFVKVFKWSDLVNKLLNPGKTINPYISALILLLVIIFCIFLFILEFYRRKSKTAIVSSVKEGTAMITLESATNQIKESISKISGTADVTVKIVPKSKGVILNIYAKICSDCNVPDKMQEIVKGAADFTVKKLGIRVLKTNLTIINLSNIKYEPASVNIEKNIKVKAEPVAAEVQNIKLSSINNNAHDNEQDKNENIGDIDNIGNENNSDNKNNNLNSNI